ncbi:MAG: DUF4136 domain-containing protein [Cyclobacteriaceae bacterium]|nr:DUF4136 domain-containing protein [Cyclobacteriaceae bacterium]MBX2957296.1 DUF4136 domain-containing protein [Cyclobacteriaceae bacterium]
MKNSYLFILALVVLVGCLGYKELPVEYDYSYKGQFKKYRSFEIMKPAGVVDLSMVNEQIESAIVSRMKFLGYRQTDNKPHLLISFKMYEDSLKFNGYNQPEIEEWVKSQDQNLNYDRKKLDMKTGTLLIQFYDRRQNRSVWQGYATTLYGPIDYNNQRHLRNAVISILDKYRFWAEGFMEGTASKDTDI